MVFYTLITCVYTAVQSTPRITLFYWSLFLKQTLMTELLFVCLLADMNYRNRCKVSLRLNLIVVNLVVCIQFGPRIGQTDVWPSLDPTLSTVTLSRENIFNKTECWKYHLQMTENHVKYQARTEFKLFASCIKWGRRYWSCVSYREKERRALPSFLCIQTQQKITFISSI